MARECGEYAEPDQDPCRAGEVVVALDPFVEVAGETSDHPSAIRLGYGPAGSVGDGEYIGG